MAKKRKGLTDDVSLDVKLQQGAIVCVKAKNLRTGSVKLISLSIADLFETNYPDAQQEEQQLESEQKEEVSVTEDTKFTGTNEVASDEED